MCFGANLSALCLQKRIEKDIDPNNTSNVQENSLTLIPTKHQDLSIASFTIFTPMHRFIDTIIDVDY
jgi:hypothetical protein